MHSKDFQSKQLAMCWLAWAVTDLKKDRLYTAMICLGKAANCLRESLDIEDGV